MFLAEMSGPRWVLMGMAVKIAQSVSALIMTNRQELTCYSSQIGLRQFSLPFLHFQ